LTHWLDGSQIYGSTYEQADSLREFSGGRLRITKDQTGRDLLPEDLQDEEECINPGLGNGNSGHCFVAGDKRVNEQVGISRKTTLVRN
jgi:peroxidase